MTLEGGCLCGGVRYRATLPALRVNYCHCETCRKAAGAPVVVWATFPAGAVTFTRSEPKRRRSSDKARRGFCADCGTALSWQADSTPQEIDLTVGSLDRPEMLPPREHLWTGRRQPWLTIADDLPRYRTDRSNPEGAGRG